MKIIADTSGEYKDVIVRYLVDSVRKFDDDSEDEVFFLGYKTSRNKELKEKYASYRKRVYLNWEAPCGFLTTKTNIKEQEYFTHVYTICPYTAEWMEGKSSTRFIETPLPFVIKLFDEMDKKKVHDVMYMGTLIDKHHYKIIDVMRNYNYIFTSLYRYGGQYRPTHYKIGCLKKWKMLAQSKISICINQSAIQPQHIPNIKSYDGWERHGAFNNIESGNFPQIKSRLVEAMGARTLNLVKKDEWNVIERWFNPGQHFFYWNNVNELNEEINYIINHYDEFTDVIDGAYEESKKYDIDYIYLNNILR